ncbi:DUF421 domain-containing protein [Aquipuribacter sp. SD81]|uniref:DUF421 domain-containing protein n=1 Tax=Aquipuribacter sp. SD81 TaxID=3127703 RepID=UPI00301B5BFD
MSLAFFPGWEQLLGTAVRTLLVYAVVLALVRVAGRRTLAQLSAFDVVVTVAAGTVVGSTALPSTVTVADGVTVVAVLFVLQVVIGALRQRFPVVARVVDFEPRRLVRDGVMDVRRAPTTAQFTQDDLAAKLREQGVTRLEDVRVAVLEPTGKVSVLRVGDVGGGDVGLFGRVPERK